jgi:hypothetical protein
MHLIFSDESGQRTEGILLAVSSGCLRIVTPKFQDTMELRMVDGRWTSESGRPVEIESMIEDGETGFHMPFVPLTRTARN